MECKKFHSSLTFSSGFPFTDTEDSRETKERDVTIFIPV